MQQIGAYTVIEELARGGMGVVYRARHARLGREVAVKVLRAGADASDVQRRRFETEARTLARLRHPNIVSVHDVGEERGAPYLVLDLVEGESLEARLLRDGALPPAEAARIAAALARALQYAHEQQVLHRDVKPANVLLARDGTPLLTDFGLAKDLDASRFGTSVTGRFMGTPGFMPPEQAKGELDHVGPRSDVFGLGATLYAMLTGAAPFDGTNMAEVLMATIERDVKAPSTLRPGLDRELDLLCLRCLEKDPARRYGSAEEVAQLLERVFRRESRQELAPAAPRREPAPGPAPAPAAGAPRWLAVAGPAALACLLLTIVLFARERGQGAALRVALGDEQARAAAAEQRAAAAASEAARAREERAAAEQALGAARAALAAARGPSGEPSSPDAGATAAVDGPSRGRARTLVDEARARLERDPPDLAGAEAALGRAVDADPALAEAWRLRARLRLGQRRAREAAQDATCALRLDARDVDAWVLRADARADLGDLTGAIDDATRALEVDPRADQARFVRGWARLARFDALGAVDDLERVIARAQEEALAGVAYNNRGCARVVLGRLPEAVDDFGRAAALWPDDPLPLVNRGMTRALAGDVAAAMTDLRQAATLDPRDVEPALWLQGLGGEAVDVTADLDAGFCARVARVYAGQLSAEALLAEAEAAPDDPERAERRGLAHGFLGLLADRDKDLERAHAHYQACVDAGATGLTVTFWAVARLRSLAR